MLTDKQNLQFVMKDGMIAASRVGNELPKKLLAHKHLAVG